MKSKPFCYAPWTTAQYANGGVSPCCEWNGEKFKGAVKDYHNSDYLDSIKTAMQNRDMNVISKTCAECITTEKHSRKSAVKDINRDVKREHYKIDGCVHSCESVDPALDLLIHNTAFGTG